jgi:dienelactone hydrolase
MNIHRNASTEGSTTAWRSFVESTGIGAPQPVVSFTPVVLSAPERGEAMALRVSVPATGHNLPVILFSHGNGQSLYGYGPLVDFWAAHGFVVFQPTHLDSRMIRLPPDDPRRALLWRSRVEDLKRVLDQLDAIEETVPALTGRVERSRIAVAGHSWGAQTASMLLGARHPHPEDGSVVDMSDDRVKAGVLFAVPGRGGDDLSPFAAAHFPFMHPDFSAMSTPALVVAGDNDHGRMTTRGPDWWTDAYVMSPGSKCLVTVFGGEHSLGGIPGYEAAETTDASPDRVVMLQRLSLAYLRSMLYPADHVWQAAVAALSESAPPQGRVTCK